MSQYEVTLLLGSNLGDRLGTLEKAIQLIDSEVGGVLTRTEPVFSAAVEFVSSNYFCNIAILIKTEFSPQKVLNLIKSIERRLGRGKDSGLTAGYTDREIDIDIVYFGNLNFQTTKLSIPHRRHTEEREFSQQLLASLQTLKL